MRGSGWSLRRAGDEGSALVLALVFLSLFGLFVAVLLSFAQTSLRTTVAVRDQRRVSFAADGGVDGAINHIRSNTSWGVDPAATGGSNTCPSFTSDVNGQSVAVTCEGAPGSGVTTPGGGGSPVNTPEYAILALGPNSGGESGISQGGPNSSQIGDSIFSNTSIDVANPGSTMTVTGNATAHSCSAPASIVASGTRNCVSPATEPDPGLSSTAYDPLLSAPPAAGTLPVCNGAAAGPGTFSGSSATSLENAINACNGTIRFAPGVYYFDFPSSNLVWTINQAQVTVVGGTPGSVAGTCDPAQAGIQFLFGGETQLNISAGTVALCADPSTTRQQIAIYGLKSSTGGSSSGTLTGAAPATSVVFTPADAARVADNTFAAATVDNASSATYPSSAMLTVTGYPNTIPAGATITSAVLRILHKESGPDWTFNQFTRSVAITPGGAGSATTLSAPPRCGTVNTVCTYSSANLSATLDTPAKINGLKVDYTASMGGGGGRVGTESVDAVLLDVSYTTPGFNAQAGCIIAAAGGCSFLNTTGSNTHISIRGTVYAPLAKLTLAHPNDTTQRLERGVIARAVSMQLPASTPSGTPYVTLPPTGPTTTAPRTVLFTASVGGQVRLRALVAFDDASASHTPDVLSWSVVR
jgi:hypothetical protein